MRTKAEAEAKLARLALLRPVDVADVVTDGRPRRAYRFNNADGSETTVEIDADPTPRQIADLAANLPVADAKRAEALDILNSSG
jgi:hypothetical protein